MKSATWRVQEPLGTDFSSGATFATADIHHVSNVLQAVGCERPGDGDVLVDRTVDENTAEKCQNQQISFNQSSVDASSQVLSSASFSISNDSSIAAVFAAQASMSVGAGGFRPTGGNTNLHKNQMYYDSLYNSTRDIQPQLQVAQFRLDFPALEECMFNQTGSGSVLHFMLLYHKG